MHSFCEVRYFQVDFNSFKTFKSVVEGVISEFYSAYVRVRVPRILELKWQFWQYLPNQVLFEFTAPRSAVYDVRLMPSMWPGGWRASPVSARCTRTGGWLCYKQLLPPCYYLRRLEANSFSDFRNLRLTWLPAASWRQWIMDRRYGRGNSGRAYCVIYWV